MSFQKHNQNKVTSGFPSTPFNPKKKTPPKRNKNSTNSDLSARIASLRAKNPSLTATVSSGNKRKESEHQKTTFSPEFKMSKPSDSPRGDHQNQPILDEDLLATVGSRLIGQFMPQIETMICSAIKDLKSDVSALKDEMSKNHEHFSNSLKKLENDYQSLSARVNDIENTDNVGFDGDGLQRLKETLLPDIEKSMSKTLDSQWKETLRNEIMLSEANLIIHGLEKDSLSNGSDFLNFCKQSLKLDDASTSKISVLSVSSAIAAPSKGKKPSFFVKLGHFSERNLCLKNAHNLPKGISMDRSVPKRYMQKYKDLKTKAWKIRISQGLQTRIDFEGHILCLKVKKRDEGNIKYGWTIHDEFSPSLSSVPPKHTTKIQTGLTPTPPLSTANLSKTIIFSNIVSNLGKDELMRSFEKLFNNRDDLEEIRMANNTTFVVTCKREEVAKRIKSHFQDFEFQSGKIKTDFA